MPQFKPTSHLPIKMPLLYRLFHRLFLHHKPTPQEQASSQLAHQIATAEASQKREIRTALETVIKHVRGEASATWACHCCQYRNTVIVTGGGNPLGVMRCAFCAHVYCGGCAHTRPLLRWGTRGVEIVGKSEAEEKEKKLPFVSVCRACGVSWRAKAMRRSKAGRGKVGLQWGFGRKGCVCGGVPTEEEGWIGFKMVEEEMMEGNTRELLGVLKEELGRR